VTLRLLAAVCMACNREPGVPMCPLCSALEDAEQDAGRRLTQVDVTPPPRKDAAT